MKNRLLLVVLTMIFGLSMGGCNRQAFDYTFRFDRAIVYMPNGEVIEGEIDSWRDFEDGDQIQVKIDGVTYLTHSSNVVLISE